MNILSDKVIKFPICLYTLKTEHNEQFVPKSGAEGEVEYRKIDFGQTKVITHTINNLLELLQFADKYTNISNRIDYYTAEVFTHRDLAYEVCNVKNIITLNNISSAIITIPDVQFDDETP